MIFPLFACFNQVLKIMQNLINQLFINTTTMHYYGAWIQLAALGIGLLGNLYSGMKSKQAEKSRQKAEEQYAKQQAGLLSDLREELNKDPLSRSDNQNYLRKLDENAKEDTRRFDNISAITGATPEYKLAQQNKILKAKANGIADMYSTNEVRKDNLRNQLRQMTAGVNAQNLTFAENTANQQVQNAQNIAGNATSLGNNAISLFGGKDDYLSEFMKKQKSAQASNDNFAGYDNNDMIG